MIVTDLDGTLLDRDTYSHHRADDALLAARRREVPVVFCSSKTRAEQARYQRALGITDPFICEDGGAIVIDAGYFNFEFSWHRTVDRFRVIEFGRPYAVIRAAVEEIRRDTGIRLKGYGDMIPAEVAEVTGLSREGAKLAMAREYQETIVSLHTPTELEALTDAFAQRGLRLSKGGRFLAVSGSHDKGMAVEALAGLYRHESGAVRLVGIGDSYNDMPMLGVVDVPVLVQKDRDMWEPVGAPNLLRVEGVGPEGWNRFVLEYFTKHEQ